jgi:hypothetical protein
MQKIEVKQEWTEQDAIMFEVWLCALAVETQVKVKEYVV